MKNIQKTILNGAKSAPIGVLDSGVGGLTVLSRLKSLLPNEKYIYFGDTKNLPYGNKTSEELFRFVTDIINFFKEKGVKAVVLGCNTTAASVYDKIKDLYPFTIFPIIQNASAKINPKNCNRIGVFATVATTASKMYTKSLKAINPKLDVLEISCPEWVGFVESQTYNSEAAIKNISEKMAEMKKFNPDKIVLGCTHYPYLTEVLAKFEDREKFINPAESFALYIKEHLSASGLLSEAKEGSCKVYVSKEPAKFMTAGKMFFPSMPKPSLKTF